MMLLALLLLASPVWAGELSNTSGSLGGELKVIQVSGAELIRCDEAMLVCEIRDPSKFPCYQKMQEAMKDAEKNHFWPIVSVTPGDYDWPTVGITDYCDELCRAKKHVKALEDKQKQNEAMWEARKRWNATMKECVTERDR